jgi:hypothetical protein
VVGLLFLFLAGREIGHGPDEEVIIGREPEHMELVASGTGEHFV